MRNGNQPAEGLRLTVLDVGQEIIRLRGTLRNASLPQEQRTVIAKALNELSEVSQDPQRVIENLNSLSLSHCHLPVHLRNGLSVITITRSSRD